MERRVRKQGSGVDESGKRRENYTSLSIMVEGCRWGCGLLEFGYSLSGYMLAETKREGKSDGCRLSLRREDGNNGELYYRQNEK